MQGYVSNFTETVEEKKPSSIITSVQVEPATYTDCHFVEEAVGNSERVTGDLVTDLYSDGAYQSPENREFTKNHNDMKLRTGKMQGAVRWELIPHEHDDGLTVREIATGKTYEAVKSVNQKGKHERWRIPWNNKTGWRYFQDTKVEAYQLRKQIEPARGRAAQEEQRRGRHVPIQFPHVQRQDHYRGFLSTVCKHTRVPCG